MRCHDRNMNRGAQKESLISSAGWVEWAMCQGTPVTLVLSILSVEWTAGWSGWGAAFQTQPAHTSGWLKEDPDAGVGRQEEGGQEPPMRAFPRSLDFVSKALGSRESNMIRLAMFLVVCLGFFLSFFPLCLSLFFFLGPDPRHMEVPRLGFESELQLLACTTAMPNSSHICNLHRSSQQRQILNPLNEARKWSCVLLDTSWVCVFF